MPQADYSPSDFLAGPPESIILSGSVPVSEANYLT